MRHALTATMEQVSHVRPLTQRWSGGVMEQQIVYSM